jgi:predicted AlkP superfamily phosphohydrolase/phosphomutase
MKILVIGLDCAAPEIVFGDPSLVHLRWLMQTGMYGPLESVVPPITVPAWMCMATSMDPGSLGVYGFRNRVDHGYDNLATVDASSFRALTIWDQVARQGGRSVLVGVPPSYPPRRINGVSVGCFLTPDPARSVYTYPAGVQAEIERLVGVYPVDVKGFRTGDRDRLLTDIRDMTRKHFTVVRHLLTTQAWDYFQFVEIGLDRIQHGFWKHHDPAHPQHDPCSGYRHVIRDYYRELDREIGTVLALIDDETLVLVASDHGARALVGGFCVNEWLHREGDLALHVYPAEVTPFDRLAIDWRRTRAWSSGGYYARVFLNVKGREPHGTIEPGDYDAVRADLRARLEATVDDAGRPLGTRVFLPEQTYREVRGVAPDLLVHFGDLAWRAVGGVGYGGVVHVQENDTGPDDCNHAQFGAFILAGPGVSPGPVQGAHLLDMTPTLLELAGYDRADTMQGRSLADAAFAAPDPAAADADAAAADERLVRERLSGLGYLG